MLIIVIAGLVLIYLLTIWFRKSFTFSTTATKALRFVHLTALVTSIILFVLSHYNIYLRGYWAPRIIFWTWVFSAMLLYSFGDKKVFFEAEKTGYDILFFLPLTFFPLVLIPFIGAGIILLFYVAFIGDNSMVLYSSDNIRIEQPFITFMGPGPPLEIYKKENLFSYKDTVIDIMYHDRLDSLKVEELSSDSIRIQYFQYQEPVQEFLIQVDRR